ncbi:MAG: hypothetical protein MJ246_07260 [Clostridia bacterium]|nr:hypothetical protein [Clostridia bacterium]
MFFLIGFDLEGLIPLIVTIDIVATAFQSEEKFLIKCNRKFFSGYSKEERSEMISHLVKNGTINGDQVIKVNQIVPDQIAIKVPGEEKGEAESHNHIKEDKQLSAFVNQSQDKLDRFQNNNYFPSADSSKLYDKKPRSERIKELRQEYKDGLMSKEDYEEALRNL